MRAAPPPVPGSTANAASPPNQGRMSLSKFTVAPLGPGISPAARGGDLPAEQRRPARQPRERRVLVGLGVEVRVHVGERIGRDQLLGVVVWRARVAAGERAGQVRHREGEDRDQAHGDPDARSQPPPRDRRERAPEAAGAAADRPREPERVAPRLPQRAADHVQDVGDGVAHAPQAPEDCGRDPTRRRSAHWAGLSRRG